MTRAERERLRLLIDREVRARARAAGRHNIKRGPAIAGRKEK